MEANGKAQTGLRKVGSRLVRSSVQSLTAARRRCGVDRSHAARGVRSRPPRYTTHVFLETHYEGHRKAHTAPGRGPNYEHALGEGPAVVPTAVARIIGELRSKGGLQGKDIANIVDVSPATVSRWSNDRAIPGLQTQTLIANLRYVVDRLSDLYTADETRLWLNARNPLLDGERVIDLIRLDRTEEVLAIIDRLSAGIYV